MKIFRFILCLLILNSCKDINEKREQLDNVTIRDGLNLDYYYYGNTKIKDSVASNYFDLGLREIQKENFINAREIIQKSNNIEPNNLIILNSLGNIECRLKNFDKSYEYFNQAIQIDSFFSPTYLNLGTTLNEDFKEEKAIEIFDKGIKLKDNFVSKSEWFYSKAIAYYNLDDIEKSIEFNEKALIYVEKSELKESIMELKNILKDK
ncbi:tetratricopeptide repeat protein [Lutibacter sp. B1]|uniref:tetratricopeptide repeat protein n=1 Tax=Lutibacter sp. B1 TaxID=2725996 RepID=UPI00145792C8|nr:hypothetical protein [Lutibacter sp. B1]NLP59412.1 hypothetical protein [Lutibacter sp. B1]